MAIIRIQKSRSDNLAKSFYTVSDAHEFLKRRTAAEEQANEVPEEQASHDNWGDFEAACNDFIDVTHGLDEFARLVGVVSKIFPSTFIEREIETLLENEADKVRSRPFFDYYEVGHVVLSKITRKFRHLRQIQGVAKKLPEWLLIGLVSQYDYFISRLLGAIFVKCPELLNDSSKQISFLELSKFDSIETARKHIVQREIESFLRDSHQDQVKRLESILKIPLSKDLDIWPAFIEIFERRNLLTHTDGAISEQYLKVCQNVGVNCKELEVGGRLNVSRSYLLQSARVMREFAVKLTHVSWRKLSGRDSDEHSELYLLRHVYNNILEERYREAEELCAFAASAPKSAASASTKLMMIVNHANALALQGNDNAALAKLSEHDWSANELKYRVSVAAVKGDIQEVCKLMHQVGSNGSPSAIEYQSWPVFRNVSKSHEFRDTFKAIFEVEFPGSQPLPKSDKYETEDF